MLDYVRLIDDKSSDAKEETDEVLINVMHFASIACFDDTEPVEDCWWSARVARSLEEWEMDEVKRSKRGKQSITLGLCVACSADLIGIDEKTIDNRASL